MMNDPYAMSSEITDAENKEKEAAIFTEKVIAKVQNSCPHTFVGEAPYRASDWCNDSSPPLRVCFNCGLMEPGWGSGSILWGGNRRVVSILRDEAYSIRRQ